ncbi:MAG: hypothetical protein ACXVGF_04645 [Blastococcus sp.]
MTVLRWAAAALTLTVAILAMALRWVTGEQVALIGLTGLALRHEWAAWRLDDLHDLVRKTLAGRNHYETAHPDAVDEVLRQRFSYAGGGEGR